MTVNVVDRSTDLGYIDVTKEWLDNANPNSHEVLESYYYISHDKIYIVDGSKNVVLDYSLKELEVANWIENTFGGEIYLNPRVNVPDGVKTADYWWNGEYWDLKEVTVIGKNVFDNRINGTRMQTKNYIFDITKCEMSKSEILRQIEKIYYSRRRLWVSKIIVKKDDTVLLVFKRKKD